MPEQTFAQSIGLRRNTLLFGSNQLIDPMRCKPCCDLWQGNW